MRQIISFLLLFASAVNATDDSPHILLYGEYVYKAYPTDVTYTEYKRACPEGMLWFDREAERQNLSKKKILRGTYWLGVASGDTKWPNGKPLPPRVIPIKECLCYDIRSMNYYQSSCQARHQVLCKTRNTIKPTPSPDCRIDTDKLTFERIGIGNRQKVAAIDEFSAQSLIVCAARCLKDQRCCSFEFNGRSKLCRLVETYGMRLVDREEGNEAFRIMLTHQ